MGREPGGDFGVEVWGRALGANLGLGFGSARAFHVLAPDLQPRGIPWHIDRVSFPDPARGVPHPLPYQGSKRRLAAKILAHLPRSYACMVEPFCGSAALSLAALSTAKVQRVVLADIWPPLMQLWQEILSRPAMLGQEYERLWHEQQKDPKAHYLEIRARFNRDFAPAALLYLLARCVKNAVRLNPQGHFNQSADHRRRGVKPELMQQRLDAAHRLLRDRTVLDCGDFRETVDRALHGCSRANPGMTTADCVLYLDPPYQGVLSKNPRYAQQLPAAELWDCIEGLNRANVPFLLSYDGRCGSRDYGQEAPAACALRRVELHAGRSSQATLLGQAEVTVESLYLSPALYRQWEERSMPLRSSLGPAGV